MRVPIILGLVCASVWGQSLRDEATAHRLAGRLAEAEPLLEKLAALEPTASNLEDYARVEVALGHLDRAEQLFAQAVQLRRTAREPRAMIVRTLHRHIEVLASLGRYEDAERAFESRPNATGPEEGVADFSVIARLYQQRQMWPQSAAAWRTVLQLQQDAWGIDDLRLAATLDSLATVHQRARELDRAEPLLRRALAIRQANRGPASPEVAQTLDQLGDVLYGLQRFSDAEPVFEQALTVWKALLGIDSPMLALNYDNLAVTKAQLSKYEEAEALYLEALKLRDSDDIRSLRNLAVVRAAQEEHAAAEPLYRRAVAMLDEPHNRSVPGAESVLADYAELLRKMGRTAEARRIETRLQGGTGGMKGKAEPVNGKGAAVNGKAK